MNYPSKNSSHLANCHVEDPTNPRFSLQRGKCKGALDRYQPAILSLFATRLLDLLNAIEPGGSGRKHGVRLGAVGELQLQTHQIITSQHHPWRNQFPHCSIKAPGRSFDILRASLSQLRSEEPVAPISFLQGCLGQSKHANQQFDFLCSPPFSIVFIPTQCSPVSTMI